LVSSSTGVAPLSPGERQEPFDAGQVGRAVERDDDEDGVDVGGEHVRDGLGARRPAQERRGARQHHVDQVAFVGVPDPDPVADCRQRGAVHHRFEQCGCHLGADVSRGGGDDVQRAIGADDTAWLQAAVGELFVRVVSQPSWASRSAVNAGALQAGRSAASGSGHGRQGGRADMGMQKNRHGVPTSLDVDSVQCSKGRPAGDGVHSI
jgi:hypothetical protein